MRRKILWTLFILSLVILSILALKTTNREDDWVCDDGQWVRHGNPSFSQPVTSCPQVQSSTEIKTIEVQPEIIDKLMDVTVFFGNIKNDPEVLNCGTTYSANRQILLSDDKYVAVMAELLKGPSEEEEAMGFFTSINSGVKLPQINFLDGILTLNFDTDFETAVGGSCRVSAIRSQIENTFKQFSEVKEVVIAVNGRVDDVLQP